MDQSQHTFHVERKVLKLFGATIRTFDQNDHLIVRAEQKAFKLKEKITFYKGEEKDEPIFGIQARQILDISAEYDITDVNGQQIGHMQRDGVSSLFIRDSWKGYGADGNELFTVREESSFLGILRRLSDLFSIFAPQKYVVEQGGAIVATFQQSYNPFAAKYVCTVSDSFAKHIGWTFVYAIPNLLAVIENKQS